MMKFLRVMLPHCFEWKVFISFICQPTCASGYVSFRSFCGFVISHFQPKCLFEKKMESFFFNFWSQRVHMAVINIPDFSGSQRNTRRDTLNFSEKNVRGRRLSCLVANKQLITLPITQKRMLCGYQVILSLELMSWEFSETSQKDLLLCSSDGMKHC